VQAAFHGVHDASALPITVARLAQELKGTAAAADQTLPDRGGGGGCG